MYEFVVEGMTCNHCVRAITQAVQAKDPQARVEVNLEAGIVKIESQRSSEELKAQIEEEGYPVRTGPSAC